MANGAKRVAEMSKEERRAEHLDRIITKIGVLERKAVKKESAPGSDDMAKILRSRIRILHNQAEELKSGSLIYGRAGATGQNQEIRA